MASHCPPFLANLRDYGWLSARTSRGGGCASSAGRYIAAQTQDGRAEWLRVVVEGIPASSPKLLYQILKVYKDQIDAERAHVASLHVQVAIAVGPAAPLGLADVEWSTMDDDHLALMDDDHDGHDAPLALMDIDWDDIE